MHIKWRPSNRDLRIFAVGQVVFLALILTGFVRRGGSWNIVAAVMGISTAVGIVGTVWPQRIRPVYLAWMIAVFPIGWLIFQVLLTLVFGLAIIPIGILLKCLGIDPLNRRLDRDCPSYWNRKGPAPTSSRYFRQF